MRYSSAKRPEGDFEGLSLDDALPSLEAWAEDCRLSDSLIADHDLDELAVGGRSLRWDLFKLLVEYGRHAGHADLLRALDPWSSASSDGFEVRSEPLAFR
jgi:hypothetical protein